MSTVYILVGCPASGKSTWAKKHLLNNPNTLRINKDEYRLMLRNQQFCEPKIESFLSKLVDNAVRETLGSKFDVIIDQTNCKLSRINQLISLVQYSADIEFIVFDISLDKAIERDSKREHPVGEKVIKGIYSDYEILRDTYAFQNQKKKIAPHIVPDFKSELTPAVIFDIDGTLALMKDRGPFDWDKVHKDDLNQIVSEQIEFHKKKGRKIIIVSGRDEICKKDTEDWLHLYGIEYDEIHMRPKDSFQRDTVVKKEIYNTKLKDNYNIISVYDDRLVVVDMWKSLGLFVFDVNQHKHIF